MSTLTTPPAPAGQPAPHERPGSDVLGARCRHCGWTRGEHRSPITLGGSVPPCPLWQAKGRPGE
jgi:hypothetical protein